MPFDEPGYLARYQEPEPHEPFAYGRRGARQLARLLREQDWNYWPDFVWDFHVYLQNTDCGTKGCALGYCKSKWPEAFDFDFPESGHAVFWMIKNGGVFWSNVGRLFDMTPVDARRIFGSVDYYYRRMASTFVAITPKMVADAIDDWLWENP